MDALRLIPGVFDVDVAPSPWNRVMRIIRVMSFHPIAELPAELAGVEVVNMVLYRSLDENKMSLKQKQQLLPSKIVLDPVIPLYTPELTALDAYLTVPHLPLS